MLKCLLKMWQVYLQHVCVVCYQLCVNMRGRHKVSMTSQQVFCTEVVWNQLEFHRTHTLCALSTISTDCTCIAILYIGLHMHALQLQYGVGCDFPC